MAQVYLGTDRVLGRRVAVKVLGPEFARDDSFVTRFRREAQAAAALTHPNVVGVFDTGSDDGTHFIVMEYVQGKTLAQVISEDAPLLPERAAEIAEAAAAGLAFAHKQGIIHRDVKPGNIMLTPSGDVKVMDFGIARATASDSITQTATVLGTATYFSPEQAQGARVDARSDIYSLGCALYEMLTAQPPFSADTAVAVAYKHVRENPVPPSALNADVPPALDAIVMKCLAKNPDNRYQSAEELQQDLARFLAGRPVMATPILPMAPTEVVERTARPTSVLPTMATGAVDKPRRWVAWAVIGLIVALLLTGLVLLAVNLLSSSPDLVTVPDVRGKTLRIAENILENQGFKAEPGGRQQSTYPKGTVADYDPKQAKVGDTIRLFISTGGPVQKKTVPDVVCEPLDQALSRLSGAGFVPNVAGTSDNPNCQPGDVSKTDPPGGTQLKAGANVQVFTVPQPSPSPSTPSPPPTTPSPPPTTPSPPPTSPSPSPTLSPTAPPTEPTDSPPGGR
jgi:eukaryotic-like serine/threonine-protein kinase